MPEIIDIRGLHRLHWKRQDAIINRIARMLTFARVQNRKYFVMYDGQLPESLMRLI